MRILFLDDNEQRHESQARNCVGHNVDRARNATEAISLMRDNRYDLVMLDHDLGGEDSENRMDCDEDGRTVARWMANNAAKFSATTAIVHSLNVNGSTEMVSILRDAGIEAFRHPFAWTKLDVYLLDDTFTRPNHANV